LPSFAADSTGLAAEPDDRTSLFLGMRPYMGRELDVLTFNMAYKPVSHFAGDFFG
jgi:hypothetical protein